MPERLLEIPRLTMDYTASQLSSSSTEKKMIDAQEVLESVGRLALALLDGFGRITGPDDIPYPK